MQSEYDVIIVGARVAGSTLAALLGDAGHSVLLLDRATFPSDTISTHFFRGGHFGSVLQQLGVLDDVLALGAPPLTCEYRYMAGSETYFIGPPQVPGNLGYALCVRRKPLDYILVQRATKSPTVHLAERTSVTKILWDGDRVTGVKIKWADGNKEVRAKIVIGADGRDSLVARNVKPEYERSVEGFRGIYFQYLRDFAPPLNGALDGPEMSFIEDEIAYVFPCDDGVTCVAVSINLEVYAEFKKDYKESYKKRMMRHKGLAERFAAATPDSKVFGYAPRQNHVRVPYGNGWALAGDSATVLDPWTGYGMDIAGTSATFLAEAIIDWFSGEETEEDAMQEYHERRNHIALHYYKTTVSIGHDLSQIK